MKTFTLVTMTILSVICFFGMWILFWDIMYGITLELHQSPIINADASAGTALLSGLMCFMAAVCMLVYGGAAAERMVHKAPFNPRLN